MRGRRVREEKKRSRVGIFVLIFAIVVCAAAVGTTILYPLYEKYKERDSYPREYSEYVEKYAAASEVDPLLVYSVMKAESAFDPDAESGVGAKGLMQMTDDTFVWMQSVLGEEGEYETSALFDPEISIRYGCALLSVLDGYYTDLGCVIAAYNAGMGSVDSWLADTEFSEDGTTLSYIPYPETASYVEIVSSYYDEYKKLYT